MTRPLPLLTALCAAAAAAAEPPRTLTLEDALATAAAHQPALRQAIAGAQASQARVKETLAPMLPQLNLGAGYTQATNNIAATQGLPDSATTGSTVTFNNRGFYNGQLTLSGTLWDFGRSLNRLQASEANRDAALVGVRTAEAAARLAVRQAFFAAAAQKELVQVARVNFANTELHYKQVEGFVQVGTRPEIDLATSRSQRANARVALVQATAAYQVARARLNQAVGVDGPTDYEVVPPPGAPVEGETSPLDQLLPEAAKARPEVAQVAAQLAAQDLTLRSARSAYWPILAASISATLRGSTTAPTPVPNGTAGVTLNWPLYEGGLTLSQVEENEALVRQLQAQADALQLQVRLDVESALTGVSSSVEALAASRDAEDAAKDQLRLAEARYQAGAGSAVELSDAQAAFTTASAQRVQAVYTLATARASLLAALGRP